MLRLSMLEIFKLFGAMVKHGGYCIILEDGTMVYDILEDGGDFIIDGVRYKGKDQLYISIYKRISKKATLSLLISLLAD